MESLDCTRIEVKEKGIKIVDWDEGGVEEENSKLSLCLVGKLWIAKKFNAHAFMLHMEKLWSPSHGLEAKEIAENGFLFQFYHWRDKERVLDGEPWLFDKNVVVLKEISEEVKPSSLGDTLTHAPFWVRVYDPPFKGRHEKNIKALASAIGTYIKCDDEIGWSRSLRFKTLMDLREPFVQEIILNGQDGKATEVRVKYERLPNICYFCGKLGHVEKDCEEKISKEDEGGTIMYDYGEWMRASPWNTRKGITSVGRDKGMSQVGRRLQFQPKYREEGIHKKGVEDVATGLSKISMQGGEKDQDPSRNKEEGNNSISTENDSPRQMRNGENVEHPLKRTTWKRVQRKPDSTKGERGDNIKKRIATDELCDEVIKKKAREEGTDEEHQVNTMSEAVVAMQPRREP